jgi:hypothetical protein
LLTSIEGQTEVPDEVVIVISGTKDQHCDVIQRSLKAFCDQVALKVLCVAELQVTPVSRNQAVAAAQGDILSFIDSDDFMFKERIEVTKKLFAAHQPRMLLHGFSASMSEPPSMLAALPDIQGRLYDGNALFDAAKETEKKHLWLTVAGASAVMHSMVSVDSKSFVKFRPDKSAIEDSWFVREMIATYGRDNRTGLFLDAPLGWYMPTDHKRKACAQHIADGNKQMEGGSLSSAEALFRSCIKIEPQHATAHSMLGAVLEKQGRSSEAEGNHRLVREMGAGS